MKTLLLTAMFILASCATAVPVTAPPETIGGQRVIDFSDRQAVYEAFQDAYKVGGQLIPVPEGMENAADAFCFAQAGGLPARALGIDLAQGVPICYASVPPQVVADRVCKSLDYAAAEVDGTVITCRGPMRPSAAPQSDPVKPGERA